MTGDFQVRSGQCSIVVEDLGKRTKQHTQQGRKQDWGSEQWILTHRKTVVCGSERGGGRERNPLLLPPFGSEGDRAPRPIQHMDCDPMGPRQPLAEPRSPTSL